MKKISFVSTDNEAMQHVPRPKPAKLYIPKWYKGFDSFYDVEKQKHSSDMSFSSPSEVKPFSTVKVCMPFLDAFTFGYIQETWCDIYIESFGEEVRYKYTYGDENFKILSTRDINIVPKEMVPEGFNSQVLFHWERYWNPVLPKGYSAFITHPLNRDDLPFRTVSGIIDSDNYFSVGKVGFFLKKGFTGIIPKGTPMYQIIPFKRESWRTTENLDMQEIKKLQNKQSYDIFSVFTGGYKKNYWNRKDFN